MRSQCVAHLVLQSKEASRHAVITPAGVIVRWSVTSNMMVALAVA